MTVSGASYDYSQINSSLFGGAVKTEEKEEDPLGRDAFLTMLVAQLKNQDPLNPMEGTDFTTQLATFSSLEQQFNANDTLEAILGALNARGDDNLIDFIGKDISAEANSIQLLDGHITGGHFSLDQPAEIVITIYDADGLEVNTLYEGQKAAGAHTFDWDGVNHLGEKLADGKYTYDILGLNAYGGAAPVKTTITGKVTGVDRENNTPYLMVEPANGSSQPILIDPDTVVKVWQTQESPSDSEDQPDEQTENPLSNAAEQETESASDSLSSET